MKKLILLPFFALSLCGQTLIPPGVTQLSAGPTNIPAGILVNTNRVTVQCAWFDSNTTNGLVVTSFRILPTALGQAAKLPVAHQSVGSNAPGFIAEFTLPARAQAGVPAVRCTNGLVSIVRATTNIGPVSFQAGLGQ